MKASAELKAKMPKPVSYSDVSTIAMVARNEGKIGKVIHDGAVKEWVGIGWIEIGAARPADYLEHPQVLGDKEIAKWNKPTTRKSKSKYRHDR
jgi:hypothetical protein